MQTRFASRGLIGVLAAIVILSFIAILLLIAFGEDLAPRDRPGATPYSRSATGYQGIYRLMEATGQDVSISRRQDKGLVRLNSLVIFTPEPFGRISALEEARGPMLVILPKWLGEPDDFVRWKEQDLRLASIAVPQNLLDALNVEAGIIRVPDEVFPWRGEAMRLGSVEDMQLMTGDGFESLISSPSGTLLAKVPGKPVWILSDPDLLANHGIDEAVNARLAIEMIRWIAGSRPVVFDATLNGFEIGENPIKSLVSPPMLGVSMLGVAGIGLLFWAAFSTFGPRRREHTNLSLGTETLIESTAGLFGMTRREGRLANDYLRQTRERLRRRLGLPRSLGDRELTELLDRMATERGLDRRFSEFEALLSKPMTRRKLLAEARTLHLWTETLIPSG